MNIQKYKDYFVAHVINVTPHSILFDFGDDALVDIPPSGKLAQAVPSESSTTGLVHYRWLEEAIINELTVTTTIFIPTKEGKAEIAEVRKNDPLAIIIGSIISAQAYPEQVVAMTPAPGYERMAAPQKRANPFKFTIYEDLDYL